jgi:CheY-like chemotaxis protein
VEGKHLGNSISLFQDVQQQEQLKKEKLSPTIKRILLVDDDPDITLTFKKGLEEYENNGNKVAFQVFTYNSPLLALTEFRVNFYDLLLIDVNMPKMNGFEFSEKILNLDLNVRICYISAGEMNIGALREQYKSLSLGCFIKKPITMESLVRILKAELE